MAAASSNGNNDSSNDLQINDDGGLGIMFKTAAMSLTQLYKKSVNQRKDAYLDGYVNCLRDIAGHFASVAGNNQQTIPVNSLFDFLNTRFAEVVQQQQQQQTHNESTGSSSIVNDDRYSTTDQNRYSLPSVFIFNSQLHENQTTLTNSPTRNTMKTTNSIDEFQPPHKKLRNKRAL